MSTTPTTLRQALAQAFNLVELDSLCHDLGFNSETLFSPNSALLARAEQVIAYIERRALWAQFVAQCHALRPQVSWPELASAHQRARLPPDAPPAPPSRANPFAAKGRINDPTLFFGRERLLREVRAELSKFSSVSLVGEGEIGKSSVLYYLFATRQRWLPDALLAYVDLQATLDQADFCATLLSSLSRDGDTPLALKRAVSDCAASGRKIIWLMDEAERLAERDIDPRVLDLLRSLAQEPAVALCLATHRPLIEVFAPRSPGALSPFHNVFTEKPLSGFTPAEMRDFLAQRLRDTGATLNDDDLAHLLAASAGGHPARLQAAARRWFDALA